jgi:hypothetical protein
VDTLVNQHLVSLFPPIHMDLGYPNDGPAAVDVLGPRIYASR